MVQDNAFLPRKRISILDARLLLIHAFEKNEILDLDIQFIQDNFLSFAFSCKAIAMESQNSQEFSAWVSQHSWAQDLNPLITADSVDAFLKLKAKF